jgi:hypothetical protein
MISRQLFIGETLHSFFVKSVPPFTAEEINRMADDSAKRYMEARPLSMVVSWSNVVSSGDEVEVLGFDKQEFSYDENAFYAAVQSLGKYLNAMRPHRTWHNVKMSGKALEFIPSGRTL